MLECLNGLIVLSTASGSIYPNTEEIYSVVFEGENAIRNIPVTAEDFAKTGIFFSSFAGEAVIELRPSESKSTPGIQISVYVKEGSEKLPVPLHERKLLDYGCDGSTWMPLPHGAKELIESQIGIDGCAKILSMREYLDFTSAIDRSLSVVDLVPELLESTEKSPAPSINLPSLFKGTLYPYQTTGFQWLAYMAGQGVSGCLLADEMGLGKTVQVICALLACRESGLSQPSLIVSPATLLENWRREFLKFAPKVVPYVHRGAQRTGLSTVLGRCDVVITSYETLLSDVSLFKSVNWGVLVLDEAQAIKNPDAKRTKALKEIPRKSAIAVTGTPVENRLTDLWSISDFLLPGRLGALSDFQKQYPENYDGAVSLEPRVRPFILRRLVVNVASDLPARIDIPQAIEMDNASAEVYERIRLGADPASPSSALVILQKLRMFCTHPWLADELQTGTDPFVHSAKLIRLAELLEEIFSCGEKALVFTSFHDMSDMLAKYLARKLCVPIWQIDGRTAVSDRQPLVDTFSQTKGAASLILNPRAAGTGLNIVAANHVIHFNLEWNPAVEDQASARSYRRGQVRPVTVHRLYYAGTVEEMIANRSQSKRELAKQSVVGSDGNTLDAAGIVEALALTPIKRS